MTLEEMEKRLKETEKRLRVYEDIEQIKQLQIRYVNALTYIKWDDLLDCFSEDSSVDVVAGGLVKGKAEIAKLFRETISKIHIGKEGIFCVHPLITVDGDKAKGNWLMYMMYAHHRTWQSLYWIQGIYDAEYAKVNGKWKFSHLQWRPRLEPPGPPPPIMMP